VYAQTAPDVTYEMTEDMLCKIEREKRDIREERYKRQIREKSVTV
jgi:hypothetical protein